MFEGINVGFIGFLVIYVRIDYWWGFVESLFYEIFEKVKKKKERQVVYLLLNRDEYYMIVVGNFLFLNWGIQEEQVVLVRYC